MHPHDLLRAAGLPARDVPERLHGGDMSDVHRVGAYVTKTHPRAPAGLFEAEAAGLRRLAAHGVPVPRVHHVEAGGIVLDFLAPGPADAPALGRAIAAMHSVRGPNHGLDAPVFLGRFPLPAATADGWRTLFVAHRLEPLLRATEGTLGGLATEVRRLAERVELPAEGPRLLHGDLWAGNVHHAAAGPHLIDPSCWWGERAVDLATMRTFGGFGPRCMAAYAEVLPIPDAVEASIPFHQLYVLLVHVHFFGAGYAGAVRDIVQRYRA